MLLILVRLTSHSDSDFECSNATFSEQRLDGADLNFNGFNYCVRKNGGKIPWFSADCMHKFQAFNLNLILFGMARVVNVP